MFIRFHYIRDAGGRVTAPCPESGTGSTVNPFTQVFLSQQKHSTSFKALKYAVVTPPIIKICVPAKYILMDFICMI